MPAVLCGSSLMFEFNNGVALLSLRMPFDGQIILYLYSEPSVKFSSVEVYDVMDLITPVGGAHAGNSNQVQLAGVPANSLLIFQIDGTGYGSAYALAQCNEAKTTTTSTTPAPTIPLGPNVGCGEGKSGVYNGDPIVLEATLNEYSGGQMAVYVNGVQVREIRAYHKASGWVPIATTMQPGVQYLTLDNLAIATHIVFEIDAIGEGTTYYALIRCTPPPPEPTFAPTTQYPTAEPIQP